jgi:hypothetical protein
MYRHAGPLELRSLVIDSDQAARPRWAAALLKSTGGPLDFVEHVAQAPSGKRHEASIPEPMNPSSGRIVSPTIQSTYALEVRRRVHHKNRWFTVEMDRFRVRERATDVVIAEGDELWIHAGRATYHCGIGSGPEPTAMTTWPDGPGVARFVARLLRAPDPPPG